MSTPHHSEDREGQSAPAVPLCSIVIPVWNRQDVIRRCLDSVFAQDFDDYEVIAVDDGSEDNSVAIMQSYRDPRMRILRHSENLGVCAARGTGTEAARGEWVVYLDSDWALEPGALTRLASLVRRASDEVGMVGGYMRWDTGSISPTVAPPRQPFGFVEYLKWLDPGGASDCLSCRRRCIFEDDPWPTDRRWESGYFLRLAAKWKQWIVPEVLAVEYTQCANRLTQAHSLAAERRRREMAPSLARDCEEQLEEFGRELRRYAPHRYQSRLEGAAMYNFLAGKRWRGLSFACRAWLRRPARIQLLALAIGGLIGSTFLFMLRRIAWARSFFRYCFKMR